MRNRKNNIERYLRGELSPAEMHALEKEALNDPFLAEALEGIEHTGTDNFLFDLHHLNKSVHHRTRKNKTIKMWGWTVGIAASVLLIAVSGFLVVGLLKNQKSPDMAMKEQRSAAPDTKSHADTVTSALEGDATADPAEKQETPWRTRKETIPGPIKPTEPAREEKKAASENDQLLANEQSIIGFESTEVEVGDKREVNVQLPGDAAQLSEVIVTEYGYATDNTRTNAASFRFAEPEGGRNGFKNYLSAEVKYPREAIKNKAEGKVTIRFRVEPDGQLTDFQVINGIGYGCDEELIRLVRQGPSWKPGTKDNQPLRNQVKVRFKFELPKK